MPEIVAAKRHALVAQQGEGVEEVEHAFPAVDAAVVEQAHRLGRRRRARRPGAGRKRAVSTAPGTMVKRSRATPRRSTTSSAKLAQPISSASAWFEHAQHGERGASRSRCRPSGRRRPGSRPRRARRARAPPAARPSRSGSRTARGGRRRASRRCSAADRGDHVVDVALEVGAAGLGEGLLAQGAAADHLHAGHGRRRAAAVDAGAGRVAAVLADHGHVVAGGDELRAAGSAA